jgi:hypothetical protein
MIHVSERSVVMTEAELRRLPEYSCTLPTGPRIGFRWRRRHPYRTDQIDDAHADWFLGEAIEDPNPELVGIRWKRIVVVEWTVLQAFEALGVAS